MTNTDTETEATEKAEARNPHAESVLALARAMLRDTLVAGGVTVAVAAVVATVWVGVSGLLGAVVGGAVAMGSALATVLMMRKTADLPPMFVMVVALGGYVGKIIVLFGVMAALRHVDALHTMALAVTMLAVILVAAGAELRAFKRTKIPTLIITDGR
ncbi:hypothetical protein SAMN05421810_101443 [Amycolatopsis arida]|uniref:ATP synthase protein I n=1 Tax=Amycolatopsis arida TaxID=587909 RepID=A0A1I5L8D7_9PSEU|nr:hypothetical protein [Amycolatopsis arida]TDX93621.1 hypothetical protein CLV69_10476 [Amycolatopsis arida]SFO93443.1 hypothetical protein SAMN05421810_101443 [Amycolatopsis arida]